MVASMLVPGALMGRRYATRVTMTVTAKLMKVTTFRVTPIIAVPATQPARTYRISQQQPVLPAPVKSAIATRVFIT